MKKLTKLIIALLLVFMAAENANASHWGAGNLEVICIDSTTNTYRFRLYFVRDCNGINPPTSVSLTADAPGCGINTNFTLNPVLVNGVTETQVIDSNLCSSWVECTTCNDNPPATCDEVRPGLTVTIYETVVSNLQACDDWTFSYTSCCRNAIDPNYISNSLGNQSWFIWAQMDNANFPHNSLPVIDSTDFKLYVCDNEPLNMSFLSGDLDGDSFVYTLTEPLQGGFGDLLTTNAGYTVNNFAQTVNGIVLDPQTGILTLVPIEGLNQTMVFAVRIEEYHNGILSGVIIRDVQLNTIQNCKKSQPFVASDDSTNTTGGLTEMSGGQLLNISEPDTINDSTIVPARQVISICAGQQLNFVIEIGDSLYIGQELPYTIYQNFTSLGASARFDSLGTNPKKLLFQFTPTDEDVENDSMSFYVRIEGDTCPYQYPTTQFDFQFVAKPRTQLTVFDSAVYCPTSDSISLEAAGGDSLVWRIVTSNPLDPGNIDFLCDTCDTITVAPPYSRMYIVESELDKFGCIYSDTAHVFVPPVPVSWGDTCLLDTIEIKAKWDWANPIHYNRSPLSYYNDVRFWRTGNPLDTGFFQWSYLGVDVNGDSVILSEADVAEPSWYLIVAEDPGGCIMYDSIEITDYCPLMIPNVITPNGDGINDVFEITSLDKYENWNFIVYNRWGRPVFESIDFKNDWDGEGLPDGPYMYHIKTQDEGELIEYKGWVQIMR